MISNKVYLANGINNRFLSDFIIRSENYARPYVFIFDDTLLPNGTEDTLQNPLLPWSYPSNLYRRGNNIAKSEDLVTTDKWQVVDNSILYYTAPPSGATVWVEVATTSEEFGTTLIAPAVERAETAATNAYVSELAAKVSEDTALVSANASEASRLVSDANAAIATTKAAEALASANASQDSRLVSDANKTATNADVLLTHADVVTTHADVVLTGNDVETTNSNVILTGLDVLTTHADVVLTHADVDTVSAQALIINAYGNIEWAGFSTVDSELIVSYFDSATSVPSIVDGDFIITY